MNDSDHSSEFENKPQPDGHVPYQQLPILFSPDWGRGLDWLVVGPWAQFPIRITPRSLKFWTWALSLLLFTCFSGK